MAYTYDDFVSAANNAGLLDQFSADDLKITQTNPEFGLSLLSLKQSYNNAQTDEQRLLATEAANQLRRNYASVQNSGGTLQYTSPYAQQISDAVSKINNYGDFHYTGEDSYKKLLASVTGENGMDYDHTQDPQWSAIKKQYLREGDRAIQDTLAKASVGTGGRPSSYAVTAAALAGGNYNAQLADAIPSLYQQELQRRMNALGAMESDRNNEYQNWQTGYNMLQNNLSTALSMEQTDFSRFLQRYADALNTYQILGYATPEIKQILGLDDGSDNQQQTNNTIYRGGYQAPEGWTYDDILKFQKEHNISGDGIWGPESENARINDPTWTPTQAGGEVLWYTTDKKGEFENNLGEVQKFGENVNPYTGTVHKDAKKGVFSNGYQPNNIDGDILTKTGKTIYHEGKTKNIWKHGDKEYVWSGRENRYLEVEYTD